MPSTGRRRGRILAPGPDDRAFFRSFGRNVPMIGLYGVNLDVRALRRLEIIGRRTAASRSFGRRMPVVRSSAPRPFGLTERSGNGSWRSALFRTPLARAPVFATAHGRVPVYASPSVATPLVRTPILRWVPLAALRLFGPARKFSPRPGFRTASGRATRARTPVPRIPVSSSPSPCSPFPWSPCFGATRPFAVRLSFTRSVGLRSLAGTLFRCPVFSGGLESPGTGCSVRANSRIKDTARTRTGDLRVQSLSP